LSHETGKEYRLLSEAEREYVTRAGTTTPYWWGTSISSSQANYDHAFALASTQSVKLFSPNPWGLYQVHGNVWDLVEDCWHDSYNRAPTDGSAWTTGDCRRRVVRGGSWYGSGSELRAAFRYGVGDDNRGRVYGLRVARTITP
jgi:formylglycine-generating enzyme required for sulfatase activity